MSQDAINIPEPHEVLRVMSQLYERLAKQTGLSWREWLQINNLPEARKNLGLYMREGCPTISEEGLVGLNKEVIQDLFEEDFISPAEVSGKLGFEYTSEQLALLDSRLPSTRMAIRIFKLGCALIPGPPQHVTFLDEVGAIGYPLRHTGCVGGDQSFSSVEDIPACCWMAVGKGSLDESSGKQIEAQEALLQEELYVPTAIETHYCFTVYSLLREGSLLSRGERVRTASESSNGNRVIIAHASEIEYRTSDIMADSQIHGDVGLAYCARI